MNLQQAHWRVSGKPDGAWLTLCHPVDLPDDEAAVLAFSTELHVHRSVSDATWAQALRLFGEQGVVDLVGINGYYALLSMVMNSARTPSPPSPEPPLRPFPDL